MFHALALALGFLVAAPSEGSVFIYKWRDKQGNLHVTDRFEGVPKELRAKFVTLRKQAEKNGARNAKGAVDAQPPPTETAKAAPPAAEAEGTSAYQRLVEREAEEKQIKEQARLLYGGIGDARSAQQALAEERANLAANPVLNAAQPVRVQRMQAIDEELKALDKDVEKSLGAIAKLLEEAKEKDYPESWVTGY